MAVKTDWIGVGVGLGLGLFCACALVIWPPYIIAWVGLWLGAVIASVSFVHRYGGAYFKLGAAAIATLLVLVLFFFVPHPIQSPSQKSGELGGLTNSQLKERTIAISTRMRTLERNYEIKLVEEFTIPLPRNATPEQIESYNAKKRIDIGHDTEDYKLELRNTILSEARELREELLSRLPPTGTGSKDLRSGPTIFLDHGDIAGASAVADAADYLEKLARALP